MKRPTHGPITSFVDIMEKAARNGRKAHLPSAVSRAIIADPAWMGYLASRREEILGQWLQDREPPTTMPSEPSSAPTGYGIAPNGTTGASAGGMSPQLTDAVSHGVSRQASAAVEHIRRRRKP